MFNVLSVARLISWGRQWRDGAWDDDNDDDLGRSHAVDERRVFRAAHRP